MTRTSAEIEKESEAQEKLIEALNKEYWDIRTPLDKQIEEVLKDVNQRKADAEKKLTDIHTDYYQVLAEEQNASWEDRVPTSPEEFGHWFRQSQKNPFRRQKQSYGSSGAKYWSTPSGNPIKRVYGVPSKGITVFGLYDGYDDKHYVAFKGTEVVGYMNFHVPQHAGDETYLYEVNVYGKNEMPKVEREKGQWKEGRWIGKGTEWVETHDVAKPLRYFLDKLLKG